METAGSARQMFASHVAATEDSHEDEFITGGENGSQSTDQV